MVPNLVHAPNVSYRPVMLAVGALGAMALSVVNVWGGALLLGATGLGLVWQLLGALEYPRVTASSATLDPLSARDYADLRRRYLHD